MEHGADKGAEEGSRLHWRVIRAIIQGMAIPEESAEAVWVVRAQRLKVERRRGGGDKEALHATLDTTPTIIELRPWLRGPGLGLVWVWVRGGRLAGGLDHGYIGVGWGTAANAMASKKLHP